MACVTSRIGRLGLLSAPGPLLQKSAESESPPKKEPVHSPGRGRNLSSGPWHPTRAPPDLQTLLLTARVCVPPVTACACAEVRGVLTSCPREEGRASAPRLRLNRS